MRYKGNFVIIAKDGWPLEQFIGHPIRNFFRRLFLGSHYHCRACLPCMNQPESANEAMGAGETTRRESAEVIGEGEPQLPTHGERGMADMPYLAKHCEALREPTLPESSTGYFGENGKPL